MKNSKTYFLEQPCLLLVWISRGLFHGPVCPVSDQPVSIQSFSSNPITLGLDENRLDQNELDDKQVYPMAPIHYTMHT